MGNYKVALTIASAAQYVDNNEFTEPADILREGHARRLLSYHFVLVDSNVGTDGLIEGFGYGNSPPGSNINNPNSKQLSNLLNASLNAPTPCARFQFLGEYLHSFEDTFSHRNNRDEVIPINLGFGHAANGHEPDKTYDDPYAGNDPVVLSRIWKVRESRTLEAELEVFKILQGYGDPNVAVVNDEQGFLTVADLTTFLREWNAIPEDEEDTDVFGSFPPQNKPPKSSKKIETLNALLVKYGFKEIPLYEAIKACAMRQTNLKGLRQVDFPGTILGTPEVCKAEKKSIL